MYINFWYPMALCEEVTDKPLKVRTLGQDFALFRDSSGGIHCVADTCAHRGGSLGNGIVVKDCIQCPYHGWQYDGAGRCRQVPTLADDASIPNRARVDSYPVKERYNVIFAFLGDLPEPERPPMLEIPEWEKEGWSTTSLVYDWDANFERVIENGLDATHTEFVHASIGLQGSFKPDDHLRSELIELDWGTAYQMNSKRLEIEHGHLGAAYQWTFLKFAMGKQSGNFRFYSFIQPVDEKSVRRYLFHARDFQLGDKADREMVETTRGFEAEDRRVIEAMKPRHSPRSAADELLLPEDEVMASFRNWLTDFDNRGWRIDQDAIRRDDNRTAFAVPCPSRREVKGWLRKEIPLVASTAERVPD